MELLTVIKCPAARGRGGGVSCTSDIWAAPFMHCVHHPSATDKRVLLGHKLSWNSWNHYKGKITVFSSTIFTWVFLYCLIYSIWELIVLALYNNFPWLKPDKTHAIGSFQFAIMANILGCFSLRRCGIWLATCNFSLNYWVAANHLTFSSSKCKYMIISRKKNPSHPPALKLGSSTLDRVYSYRYLGLLLTLSLCWTERINDICAKAKRMVGLLYRRFYKDASPQTLFQMYLALVRPATEYASQVWDPHPQKDIDQLEHVQKFTLRMHAKQWNLGYAELLNHFKVPSLGDRRKYLSLCTMYIQGSPWTG